MGWESGTLIFIFLSAGLEGIFAAVTEWVDKRSSRIWRGSLANSAWRHVKEGGWAPREKPARGKLKSVAGRRTKKGEAEAASAAAAAAAVEGPVAAEMSS